MVEGPGATHNAVKAKKAVGGLVALVECSHPHLQARKNELVSRRLRASFAVGKEVFLLFGAKNLGGTVISNGTHSFFPNVEPPDTSSKDEIALRLHFGMNGVLWCYKENASERPIPSWRTQQSTLKMVFEATAGNESFCSDATGTMGMQFNNNRIIVQALDATANLVSANVARSKFSRLHQLDACNLDSDDTAGRGSSAFDAKAVCDIIRQKRPNDLISDAILNQDLFPGVGNIIKIEGLHHAKVHPQRLVSNLTENELRAVVDQCRKYAMEWYNTGRAGPKMVYNQNQCQTCRGGPVRMVKIGNDLSRVTFWCDSCQPINPSSMVADPNRHRALQNCQPPLRPVHYHEACPTHGAQHLKLKRVRKLDSGNALRLFRTCAVPNCSYFEWADTSFPHCKCKGSGGENRARRTILRVSKTQRSGGRWFFSCANSSDPRKSANAAANKGSGKVSSQQGCGFFEWASPAHLAPFGKALTPLL